ncbi:FAD-dependent oxidoreductase [Slackia heliotrinireducens]|uniref:Succinate dehydrogenase/fumarate reductase flavoprotein subunit n=1 Tax=Slackia heliotrinireducens (strain ATCC 29202 / DSM 20476 / NCTC 11029 / RHS 1) TaxID=471855 RepID=C7N275_SLAHD|nr:FAD-dependent oxidoreductase [Slackia heliotrinireducens]ACV21381.1 succinate dehydrogenase/fumarate reductase flavoprotein subunit [Slackia heliotrinireducens DSM 20476]
MAAGLPARALADDTSVASSESADGYQVPDRPAPNSRMVPSPQNTGITKPNAEPIPPEPAPAAWDEEYDVVIVGSGWGGLTAANMAAQGGLKTALIEKGDVTGGASRHAAENAVISGGSKAQEEAGYHWPGDKFDPKAATTKYEEYCSWTVDYKLLYDSVIAGAEWIDWMMEQPGIEWVAAGPCMEDIRVNSKEQNTLLGNHWTAEALTDNAIADGVEIKLLTQCKALIQDGDRVVGIKVADTLGNETYLKGAKAVLLTAGGFGMNLDLLEKYTPTAYMYATQGGPMPSHTGECFRMGLGVGADVSGFNSFSMWEGGLDEYWGNGDGNYFHHFWNGAKQVMQNPWLKIDITGRRMEFFAKSTGDGIPQENYPHLENCEIGDLTSANHWSSSIGHRAYNIFDSKFKESLKVFENSAMNPNQDAHRQPVSEDRTVVNTLASSTEWEKEFEEAVARGAISKADTLEELAEMLGLRPERVTAAVDHWNNDICAKGEDTDLPAPYKEDWLIPVDTPPYYGAAMGGQISKTMAGLRVNEKMQVINAEGDPIPGLYAGWYTAGGIGGVNNYGGIFGNPTIHAGVAISGVGGYMAMNAILANE